MSEWRVVRIGEVGTVTTGRTPPSSRPECFGEEMPFITPSDMTGSRTVEEPQRFLSEEGADLLRKCVVEKGVAVSCIGWQMGKALLIEEPSVTNQQINTVVPATDDVDLLYLYYDLSARRDEIFRLGSGGSRTPILNKSVFSQLEVALPPLHEQRRIAHILGTLDDKIELNRRMNQTLEEIARAIFKSWFIDFDPVIDNAILNGKPIPDEFAERAEVRREILARSQPSPPAPLPEVEGRRNYRGGFEFAGLVERARELRQRQTPAEEVLWEILRDREFLDLKFRRQHQIGDYIADFYCHECKLVIELDGGIHRTKETKDAKRDAYMKSLGLTVLRIPNTEVLNSIEDVLTRTAEAAGWSPSPSGRGGGEGVAGYRHLFPDSFQGSPLGMIPKGWDVSTVEDLGGVVCGKTPRTAQPENYGAGIPFITIPDMRGAVFVTRTARELTPIGTTTQPKKLLPSHSVCVSCIATPGLVSLTSEPSHTNQQINSIVCKDGISPYWCYLQMQSMSQEVIAGGSGGSATLNLNKRQFSALTLPIPPEPVQSAYHRTVGPVFGEILSLAKETASLEHVRNALLPHLMSGKLQPFERKQGGGLRD